MPLPNRLLVISDLHLGAADGLNIFHAQDALARFVRWASTQPGRVELVILGDGVDFLQMKPWLGFTTEVALVKTARILAHNAGIFEALRDFLKPREHTLRWFAGNHDIELLFPEVRERFEAAARGQGKGQLCWRLDGGREVYPLPTGGAIHLAHGNAGDPWNEIDYAGASATAEAGGSEDFNYPPGSRLVAEVLNPLKEQGLTHIDLLKPEVTVAIPLALAAWPEQVGTLLGRFLGLEAKVGWKQLKRWSGVSAHRGSFSAQPVGQAAPTVDEAPDSARALLAGALVAAIESGAGAGCRDDDLQGLAALLVGRQEPARMGPPGTFGAASAMGLWMAEAALKIATSGEASLLVEQRDDRTPLAEKNLSEGAALVVVGHTHLARAASLQGGHYLNTGTWADLMRLPRWLAQSDLRYAIAELRTHLANPARAPWYLRPLRRLTYVDIRLGGGATLYSAALCQWPSDEQVVLAQL